MKKLITMLLATSILVNAASITITVVNDAGQTESVQTITTTDKGNVGLLQRLSTKNTGVSLLPISGVPTVASMIAVLIKQLTPPIEDPKRLELETVAKQALQNLRAYDSGKVVVSPK